MNQRVIPDGTVHALTDLVVFLLWLQRHDPRCMYGGRTVDEAVESLTHLTGIPVSKLKLVAFGKE